MSELVLHREQNRAIALPEPRIAISIRQAVPGDLPFIDQLQKKHSKMVGWFPTKQLETNIARGQILIAEEQTNSGTGVSPVNQKDLRTGETAMPLGSVSLGYCISTDRYFKRDDCGIVYQLNVVPTKQRGLIGATLIKAVFERAAYGCKLFCCWCAQDLEANHFWESIGFVPLAFRTGSRPRMKKDGTVSKPERIHIFWQKRIREGDVETPYWFPSETSGGAVRENRIILPIPPGTHWSDAKPAVLPGMEKLGQKQLEGGSEGDKSRSRPRKKKSSKPAAPAQTRGGLWFGPMPEEKKEHGRDARATRPKREPQKNDPKLVAAARELRDRYMEQFNAPGNEALLPATNGKYDVSRQLEAATTVFHVQRKEAVQDGARLLDAA